MACHVPTKRNFRSGCGDETDDVVVWIDGNAVAEMMTMKTTWMRWGMGGTLLILALGIGGCALPDVPEAVSWDTELQLPLAARTFGMWDLADNDSVLRAEGSGIGMTLPDSALFFSYSRELVPVRVGEKLKLDGFNHEIQQPMRMLKIPLGVEQTQAATLGAVNPALAARHGVVMDVPPYAFNIVVAVPLSGFRRACVDSGTVAIRVASSLPYAAQSLTVTWLADRDHPQAVYHGELSATQAAQAEPSLQGKCLEEAMYVEVTGTAAGGIGVLVDSTQGFMVSLTVGELFVHEYVGPLPRQELAKDSLFALEQQHEIHDGEIATGRMTVHMVNHTPFPDSVRVIFNDLYTPAGNLLSVVRFMDPEESADSVVNLEGHTLRLDNPDVQEIHGRLEAITPPTTEEVHYLASDQTVSTEFTTSELRFRRFDGTVHDLESTVERDSSDIEQPPEGWENVHATTLEMRLKLNSDLPVQSDIRLDLYSTREGEIIGSETRTASCPLNADSTLVFGGLSPLVTRIPEWIGYKGTVLLNGPVVAYDTTAIYGTLEMTAPLSFTIDNTLVPGKVERVEANDMEDVREVRIAARLWNALPVTGSVRLLAARDSLSASPNSMKWADTLCAVPLPPAELIDGRVANAGYMELEIAPPPGFYDLLEQGVFYIRTELAIDGSAGDTLAANGSDYVKFAANVRVLYRVAVGD